LQALSFKDFNSNSMTTNSKKIKLKKEPFLTKKLYENENGVVIRSKIFRHRFKLAEVEKSVWALAGKKREQRAESAVLHSNVGKAAAVDSCSARDEFKSLNARIIKAKNILNARALIIIYIPARAERGWAARNNKREQRKKLQQESAAIDQHRMIHFTTHFAFYARQVLIAAINLICVRPLAL
jgi:hypothetical protein